MDFPSSLRPALFMTGPLGMSSVPDLSFMCSWRDVLTLPESQPHNSKVRMTGPQQLPDGPFTCARRAFMPTGTGNLLRGKPRQSPLPWGAFIKGYSAGAIGCSLLPPFSTHFCFFRVNKCLLGRPWEYSLPSWSESVDISKRTDQWIE
jgi:hypothetical protein